jgi:hypothetical protein
VTVPFQDFTNEVRVYFPDMPEPVVLGAVRNAAIEFCEKSLYWTYEHDPISAVADLTEYEFDLPEDTEVAKIIDGWYDDHVRGRQGATVLRNYILLEDGAHLLQEDGYRLVFASEERLQGQFQTPWRQTTGSAAFITQMDPQSFLLAPAPAENITDAIRLIVALKPTRDAPGIDDMFYSRWLEEIAGGARARLYAIPGHQTYNPTAAVAARRQFAADISSARIERNRGLTRATLVVRPKSWV